MMNISTIVSGAASLAVLIGLISGIFFLVLTALRWVSRMRESLYEEELRRQKMFLLKKSQLLSVDSSGVPETRKAGDDFESFLNVKNVEKINHHLTSTSSTTQWGEHKTDLQSSDIQEPTSDTIRVRETIEKIVEKIIGGPLDGTTVGQLSSHSACKNVIEQDSTDLKQPNLKRLIKRIINEVVTLPNIKEILCRPKSSKETENEDFKNKSYEDILSTAILNKIIENFQTKNGRGNDVFDGNFKPHLRSEKGKRNNEEDLISDDDWSDTSRSDKLSLTIEEYIEEVTTTLEVSDEEDSEFAEDFDESTGNRRIPFPESGRTVIDGTDKENSDLEDQSTATELITSTSSWEENWLFQKKRLRSTPNAHHPVPVPMLVPNPSEDFRALVGGVDADDLSDMSDCSDAILEDFITTEEKNSAQLQNEECEEPRRDCKSDEKKTEKEKKILAHIEKETFSDNNQRKVLKTVIWNGEKNNKEDALKEKTNHKYEETNKVTVEEHLFPSSLPEDLSQKDRDSSIENFSHQYESINSHSSPEGAISNSAGPESESHSVRCPTAEREKEKWMNPVFLADNPYTFENLEKRGQKKNEYFRLQTYSGESINFPDDLSCDELSKNETEKIRFSRDYYVNASKHPSGMRSPSFKEHSQDHEQKAPAKNTSLIRENVECLVPEMENTKKVETTKCRTTDKSRFSLPSVKELAKQFTRENSKEPQCLKGDSQAKQENKHKTHYVAIGTFPEKEPETDYSTVPVSEIILNLQQTVKAQSQTHDRKQVIYYQKEPATRMDILRKTGSNTIIENHTEKGGKHEKVESMRFNGKQVHSLTARSISKEFREGLKNSSYQKSFMKTDRTSSGGESDQGEIVSSKTKTSPTPSIDLKNVKKFWEQIITSNSNSTRQK